MATAVTRLPGHQPIAEVSGEVWPGPRQAAGMEAGGRGVVGEEKGNQRGLCPDQAEDL